MNEITIYDVIGQDFFGEGVTATSIKSQLDGMQDATDITVRLNSPGGDVFEGLAIYNLLSEHPAKVTVKVDGYAASIASVIALAGDSVMMGKGAMFMIHNPYTFSVGDAKELRAQADVLDQVRDSLVETYQTRMDSDVSEIHSLLDAETWFSPAEAKEIGLATHTTDEQASIHNLSGCRWINKAPDVQPAQEPTPNARPDYLDYLQQSQKIAQNRAALAATRKNLSA